MSKKAHGRPTDCTPEIIAAFSQLRRRMLPYSDCCAMCGISTTSYKSWLGRGEDGEEPFASFLSNVKKAEAEWTEENLGLIKKATEEYETTNSKGFTMIMRGDWTAAAWLLERQKRSEFGRYATRITLPPLDTTKSEIDQLIEWSNNIAQRMSTGELTVESADLAMNVIEKRRKLIETMDHEQRLKETEERLKKMGA